ncbi:MAG: M48 family metallopeptidase [Rhodobiaceae bacterium]|nr:M48 family metallopeptidase [Rhodobiaceae bacterium]MCC0052985.1 M48 family metallopeptidase [Rhodobiaceae bacterium]
MVRRMLAVVLAVALAVPMLPARVHAQGGIQFVRDAEIEELLREYTEPILRAAGVGGGGLTIYLVPSKEFNAFVIDGRRIFVNVGTLMQSETPNEVIGVLAHEIGHIAGGHLAGLRNELRAAAAITIVQLILAGAAAAAGSGQAAGAIIAGGQQIAQRSLLSYRRAQEQAADRSAINYLNATHQSGKGMVRTFERFADQQLFSSRYVDPYAVSHPMARDRVAALDGLARQSPYYDTVDPPRLQLRHDLMRAKVAAYVDHPNAVKRRYPKASDSLAALYAHTIIRMRSSDYKGAIAGIDQLLKAMPDYAYFWEMKGEILTSAGRPRDAVAPLRKAVSLAPRDTALRVALGKAYVVSGDKGLQGDAIKELARVTNEQRDHAEAQRYLARAYGAVGRIPEANLASAEAALASGDYELAKQFAARTKQGAKTGTPVWLRAQDILQYRPPGR